MFGMMQVFLQASCSHYPTNSVNYYYYYDYYDYYDYYYYYYYYYNHFTALWILSMTTRMSQYQKGTVKPRR